MCNINLSICRNLGGGDMQKSLKIMEWNLNFQSDKKVKIASFIKDRIENEDIIIFTEIVKSDSVLQFMKDLNKYNFYESYNTVGNQIIICIKKDIKVTNIINKMPDVASVYSPDFLHVEIDIGGVKYQIIGVRIRIGDNEKYEVKYKIRSDCNLLINYGEDKDYIDRKIQAIQIANYISDMNNVIMLGDFNTSYIRGCMNHSYYEVREKYEMLKFDKKKDFHYFLSTRFYNYQMMCDLLGKDVTVHTPKYKFSWGLSYFNDIFKYGYIKNDHLITSSNICVEKVDYDWSFVEQNKEKYKKTIKKGYPDHAVLCTKVKL